MGCGKNRDLQGPSSLTHLLAPPPATLPSCAADFLMACAQEVYAAVMRAGGKPEARALRCALRCSLHAARGVVVLAAVSLGE